MPVSLSSSPLSVHAATNTDQTIQKYPRCYLYKLFSDESRERLTFSRDPWSPGKISVDLVVCLQGGEKGHDDTNANENRVERDAAAACPNGRRRCCLASAAGDGRRRATEVGR